MRALNVLDPTHYVKATSSIPTMIELLGKLIEAGAAYPVEGGSVFFRIASRGTYGELSKLSREQMLEIANQQDDADTDDPRKEDPLDFALWKGWSGREDEPCWDSPWGRGRPGWHLECSALCYEYIGPQVTLHGGGADLVYPHHESEIVQSETATGQRPFVRLWTHVAMVYMDGAKMSKSLGNMVFVHDLLGRYSADAIRLYLLSHHYRQVWEWSAADLDACADLAARLKSAAAAIESSAGADAAFTEFRLALEDDLNLPRAIEVVERLSGAPLRELGAVLGLTFV
jgi:L-cysteine:1D-myo-inositol 2-amino-2-deoxy-alpha-D-glucopyranoside ligase